MYSGATVFTQLMQQLPWWRFQDLVDHYQGDYKTQTFRCAEHFRVMAFAQLTCRESLRAIEACLRAIGPKLYHMGIRSTVAPCGNECAGGLEFLHVQRKDRDDLTYYLETTTNLVVDVWTNDHYVVIGTNTTFDTDFNEVTNQIPTDVEQRFIRLIVE